LAANVAAAEEKAQAVHVMQTYETSLGHSSAALAGATGGADSSTTTVSGYVGPDAGGSGGLGGGVPWNRLVGGSPLSAGMNASRDLSGVGMLDPGSSGRLAPSGEELAGNAAAEREGMAPGTGRSARRDEDREHSSSLPTVDHKLFDIDVRATPPVIGA
jgi:hypothetical protein